VNLETASASERAREIGVRRTLGAKAWQVAVQSVVRTGVVVTVGTLLALAAVTPLHRFVGDVWGAALAAPWSERRFWVFLAAVVAGVTLLAARLPAYRRRNVAERLDDPPRDRQ
jgi:ABC-type antimicrobial peptide transport system permease subunit